MKSVGRPAKSPPAQSISEALAVMARKLKQKKHAPLRQVLCFGCRHGRNCAVGGCALLRRAAAELERYHRLGTVEDIEHTIEAQLATIYKLNLRIDQLTELLKEGRSQQ